MVVVHIFIVGLVISRECITRIKARTIAVKNRTALGNHGGGEGELLAVKNQDLLSFIELVLGVLAGFLETINAVEDLSKALVHLLVVVPNVILVSSDSELLRVVL